MLPLLVHVRCFDHLLPVLLLFRAVSLVIVMLLSRLWQQVRNTTSRIHSEWREGRVLGARERAPRHRAARRGDTAIARHTLLSSQNL